MEQLQPDKGSGKTVGCTVKLQPQNDSQENIYYDLILPKHTKESLGLESEDMIHLKVRNPDGKTVTVSRKISLDNHNRAKTYFPKGYVEELGADDTMLLDLFIRKD